VENRAWFLFELEEESRVIQEEMEASKETHALLDRLCNIGEREELPWWADKDNEYMWERYDYDDFWRIRDKCDQIEYCWEIYNTYDRPGVRAQD
jgi:hypothetical protein